MTAPPLGGTPLPPAPGLLLRRLGVEEDTLDDADLARIDAALDDATALALAEVSPTKAAAWTTSAPKVVALVILKAARREYENPTGVVQEAVGEVSTTVSVSTGVFLTDTEKVLVRRAASGRRGGFVGTIRTPSAYTPEHRDTSRVPLDDPAA